MVQIKELKFPQHGVDRPKTSYDIYAKLVRVIKKDMSSLRKVGTSIHLGLVLR